LAVRCSTGSVELCRYKHPLMLSTCPAYFERDILKKNELCLMPIGTWSMGQGHETTKRSRSQRSWSQSHEAEDIFGDRLRRNSRISTLWVD